MDFQVISWKNKDDHIYNDYVCDHNKMNKYISPLLKWNSLKDVKSYSLIFQDCLAHTGDKIFVHWYVPYIDPNINQIDKLDHIQKNISLDNIISNKNNMKIISGENSLNKIGYYPPCPPKINNYNHIYTFYLYSLDGKIDINNNSLKCHSKMSFEKYLRDKNINVLMMEEVSGKFHF